MTTRHAPIRLARVVGRLNIGGPALQALHLTRLLEDVGFETRLFHGREAPDEGSMDYLAATLGVRPVLVESMRREVGARDVRALYALIRELRRYRPAILHSEAAKGGTLGRLAALLAPGRSRPVLVHTFHGHSLEGYFSARKSAFFIAVERFLARRTRLVIAVSEEVKQDLLRLGVTTAERTVVVPVGLDLKPFDVEAEERARRRDAKRAEWGIPPGTQVVTLVARLVPIKRVDRFLRIAGRLAEEDSGMRFVIVGGGELRETLQATSEALALGDRLQWVGFERDMPNVCFASDCVVLTSDNEGTPVSLIEAQAAGVPTVSTRVGGAASVVLDGETGRLVAADDEVGFAAAVQEALQRGAELGAAGRAHVATRFSIERLVQDLAAVYRSLLAESESAAHEPWTARPPHARTGGA